ncbi:hypothetical protein CLOM_g4792 [Closterium sp. NIES-68]|nr:hypothetical protein CLOM_g4792 [Closterium sp. NIES-68]GJP78200.1 hypothetical protein CLOP_g8531 [Closterium sp. NIES-67]
MPSSYALPAANRAHLSPERDGGAREVAERGEPAGAGAEVEREASFAERVARSIFVDELCPAVTPAVLQSALGQFGAVRSVQLVPNLLLPRRSSGCAIVELHSRDVAAKMLADLSESLLIVGAGPRPVRACKARADMFDGAFVFPSALHAAALSQPAPAAASAAAWHGAPCSSAPALPGFRRARRWKEVAGRQAEEMKMLAEHVAWEKQQVGERQRVRIEEDLRRLTLIDHAMAPNGAIAHLRHYYGMPAMDWHMM